jgi:hypothetical protein
MQPSKSFQTKTGFCHILPDKILLTREGFVGEAAHITTGNSLARPLMLYSLIAGLLLYTAYTNYVEGDKIPAVFFTAIGIWLAYGIISSLNNSTSPVIDRNDIQRVLFKKAIPGLTRSRFEIFFKENGRVKRRLIMLPGSLSGGPNETAKALEIMKSEKLLAS